MLFTSNATKGKEIKKAPNAGQQLADTNLSGCLPSCVFATSHAKEGARRRSAFDFGALLCARIIFTESQGGQLVLSKSGLRFGAFVLFPVFVIDIRLLSSTASFSAANWFS